MRSARSDEQDSAHSAPSGRDWSRFVQRTSTFDHAPSSPRPSSGSVLFAATRGGDRIDSDAIAHGESVIVLLNDSSYSSLCCGLVGQTGQRICFKAKSVCTTDAHLRSRIQPSAGIYIKSKDADKVFLAPVGDIAFFRTRKEEILSTGSISPAEWSQKFALWNQASTADIPPASLLVKKREAKAAQTPGKRKVPAREKILEDNTTNFSPSEIKNTENQFNAYERLWRFDHSSSDPKPLVPDEYLLSKTVLANMAHLFKLQSDLTDIKVNQAAETEWTDNNLETVNLRLGEIEAALGEVPSSIILAPNVWTSLAQNAQDLQTLESELSKQQALTKAVDQKIETQDQDLTQLFQRSMGAFEDINRNLTTLTTRVDNLNTDHPVPAPSSTDIASLIERIEALETERKRDRTKIELLESRLGHGDDKFDLGGGHFLQSAGDVRAYLMRLVAMDIDFGGFVDVYNIFTRLHQYINSENTLHDVFKAKKDIKGLDLSEDEALVVFSHTSVMPPLFGGKRSEKTEIGNLPTYAKWRTKSTQTGVAFDMEKYLSMVQGDVESIIREQYGHLQELSAIANRMLIKSIDFVSQFIRWIDDTYAILLAGGNPSGDCWWLITRVIRCVFEDYLAPKRLTPTKTKYSSSLHQASVLIWGSVRCYLAADKMLQRGFKDHPVVVGAYSTWLVSNSGRKEASTMSAQIASINNNMATVTDSLHSVKKELSDLKSSVKSVKSTADSALSKVGSLKNK